MDKALIQMVASAEDPLERTKTSRLLSKIRMDRRQSISAIDPGRKMIASLSLSIEARKMLIAGLRSQGFSELEIRRIIKARRR